LIAQNSTAVLMQAAQQSAVSKARLEQDLKEIENAPDIEQAAKDFEAVFLSEIMKPMFKEINEPNPLFGGGHGERVFNGMMLQEYGKIMAESGGIGLADHVKAELINIQQSRLESQEKENGDR